ncbi:MAG: hypothetical protein ABH851_00420 [Methanobacteriota archaeon]
MTVSKLGPTPAPGGGKVRILVLDDEHEILEEVGAELASPHREIDLVQVISVSEGVSAFRDHDILITDQRMEAVGYEGGGMEVVRRIRKAALDEGRMKNPVAIINSTGAPNLTGDPYEADYTHSKRSGIVKDKDGELDRDMVRGYGNLLWLVEKIEAEQLTQLE